MQIFSISTGEKNTHHVEAMPKKKITHTDFLGQLLIVQIPLSSSLLIYKTEIGCCID